MAGVWSGYLTFGLVTLPVRLFSGARGERVSFHLLHAPDHARLQQQMICSHDGQVVERKDTVRGYEYAKDAYVVIPEEQIRAAAPHTERQLEIVQFCRAEEIDPVWFESSYYLMPETAGQRPYALLLEAMRESGYWALAQLSMHNREYLSLVRPSSLAGVPGDHAQTRDGHERWAARERWGLLLHTLYYVDEIRVADGFGSIHAEPKPAELNLAKQLIEGLAQPFDPTRFEDHYRKNLEQVVEAALEGKPATPAPAPRRLQPVADLMQSLKASLERQGGQQTGQQARKPPAAAAKSAPRRRKPRAA
ncbi:MAG: Ku protein [Terriglobales bacterium]